MAKRRLTIKLKPYACGQWVARPSRSRAAHWHHWIDHCCRIAECWRPDCPRMRRNHGPAVLRLPSRLCAGQSPRRKHGRTACQSQAHVPRHGGQCCCRRRRGARNRAAGALAPSVSQPATPAGSDGFEIKCESGQTVNATFAKDCCDREIMAFAWEGKGLPGEPVREMQIEAVRETLW